MNQQALINMLLQRATGNNPVVNNAVNMYRNGNAAGLEQLARNLCQSNRVNPDEALQKVQNMIR